MDLPARCPFATWKPYPKWGTGKPYTDTQHYKVVWHTTQGSGIGALSWYNTSGGIPKFTITEGGTIYQHWDMNLNDRGLRNLPGGVQTNFDGAISIEIAGYAGLEHSSAQRESITELTSWLVNECNIPPVWLNGPPVSGPRPKRLSHDAWDNGSGFCGHVDVPENDHTDPGFTQRTLRAVEKGFSKLTTTLFADWRKLYNKAKPFEYNAVVEYVQQFLKSEGLYDRLIDGEKGPVTDAAVVAFKLREGTGTRPRFGKPAWQRMHDILFAGSGETGVPVAETQLQELEVRVEEAITLLDQASDLLGS